jgi:hypothetical protein
VQERSEESFFAKGFLVERRCFAMDKWERRKPLTIMTQAESRRVAAASERRRGSGFFQ